MQKIRVNLFISVVVNILYTIFIAISLKSTIAVSFQLKNGFPSFRQSSFHYMATQVGLCLCTVAFFLMLPWLLKRLPIKNINIPNRKQLLKGEEREQTLKKLDFMFLLLGTIVIYFFTAMNMVIYIANISTPLVLPILPFLSILFVFLGFVVTWSVKFYKMF